MAIEPEEDSFKSQDYMENRHKCLKDNFKTTRGRRRHLIKMMLLLFVPICGVLIESAIRLITALQEEAASYQMKNQVTISIETVELIHRLQTERGLMIFYAAHNTSNTELITKSYNNTDKMIGKLIIWPLKNKNLYKSFMRTREKLTVHLHKHRAKNKIVNITSINHYLLSELQFYENIIEQLIDHLSKFVVTTANSQIWQAFVGLKILVASMEESAIVRELGMLFFIQTYLSNKDLTAYVKADSLSTAFLRTSQVYSPKITEYLTQALESHVQLKFTLDEMQKIIQSNTSKAVNENIKLWYRTSTTYINIINIIQKQLSSHILQNLDRDIALENTDVTMAIVLLFLVLCVSPLLAKLMLEQVTSIQKYASDIIKKTDQVKLERERANSLLYRMLPRSVATELKQNKCATAEYFDQATIYFSDIVAFTELSSRSTPLQIIELLNALYLMFDNSTECYNVYKVETIGDAYMVASGVPLRNGRKHVLEICNMALHLRKDIEVFRVPHIPNYKLQLRIGIHSGPCMAGVVGSRMPRYCLFGDAVNTASRLETTGLPNKIHISKDSCDLLMIYGGYEVESRGSVELKGKGNVGTYWLVGRIAASQSDSLPNTVQWKDKDMTLAKKRLSEQYTII